MKIHTFTDTCMHCQGLGLDLTKVSVHLFVFHYFFSSIHILQRKPFVPVQIHVFNFGWLLKRGKDNRELQHWDKQKVTTAA